MKIIWLLVLAVSCSASDIDSVKTSTWVQTERGHFDRISVKVGDWVEVRLYCPFEHCGMASYFVGAHSTPIPLINHRSGLDIFGAFSDQDANGKLWTSGVNEYVTYTVVITVAHKE